MTLSRRQLAFGAAALSLSGLAAPVLAQSLSAEDRALVDQASAYLQNLTSAQGTFTETGPGGQTHRGRFWLQRPGKMRFEYTTPEGLLVVSDGNNVSRYDPRISTFRQVPLGQTPLSTFLSRNVRLAEDVRVDRVTRSRGGAFAIVARDRRRPNEGSAVLAFAGSPMRLQEWTLIDAQGQRTRVQLNTLQPASGLASSLFVLRDPTRRPGRN